jgi:hypothetical protein
MLEWKFLYPVHQQKDKPPTKAAKIRAEKNKMFSSEYNLFFNGLMEPKCLNVIFIGVCVC